jgi:hypothetical protein
MDLQEANKKAVQLLDEERMHPTVKYISSCPENDPVRILRELASGLTPSDLRRHSPREIVENARTFMFQSTNYELLCALLSQLGQSDHSQFVQNICLRLSSGDGARRTRNASTYPMWNWLVSDLPLVAEFLVRNGGKAHLFAMLASDTTRMIPGHPLLLMQLEDLIAFNYTQFSDSEYVQLSSAISRFGTRASKQSAVYRMERVRDVRWSQLGAISATALCDAVSESCAGIAEQCRQARYYYLKGDLQEGLNLEVNQDKNAVGDYLHQLSFSASLLPTLDEAERLYHSQGTPYDSKHSLGLLRSFLENVQKEAMPLIHSKYGGDLKLDWGGGLAYLAQHEILSKAEEQFAVGLYRLISDEGVHPLIAQREYVRLTRNMVVEYTLLFLTKLTKLGLASAT